MKKSTSLRRQSGLGTKSASKMASSSPLAVLVAVLERAGFETRCDPRDGCSGYQTLLRILRDDRFGDLHCFVSRIVEHLDLELFARVVDFGNGFHQPIHDVHLVEERQLDGDARQLGFGESGAGPWDEVAIAPEVDDLLDAIGAVDGQRSENREIDDQDDPVEGIELVKRADISPGFVDSVVEIPFKDFPMALARSG